MKINKAEIIENLDIHWLCSIAAFAEFFMINSIKIVLFVL